MKIESDLIFAIAVLMFWTIPFYALIQLSKKKEE